MSKLKQLRDKLAQVRKDMRAIHEGEDIDSADENKRNEAEGKFKTLEAEAARIEAAIKREEQLLEAERNLPSVEEPAAAAPGALHPQPKTPQGEGRPFGSFGQFLQAVAHAGIHGRNGVNIDLGEGRQLIWGAASGAGEAVPADGGFLVQQDFRTDLLTMMHDMGEIISRVRGLPISTNANSVKLPAVDETSRVDGSRWGGIRAYWADEAATVTATKVKFREISLTLNKLFGLGYVTEELLEDAALLEAIMQRAFAEELLFKAEDSIINGDGSGKPLGLVNSGALITVTPESGQGAQVIRTQNILDMWARMPARRRKNAVWLINQDVEPQLYPLTLGSGTAVVLLYFPPGSSQNNSEYGRLMGRPVIPVEYCATLGTAGDIILCDLEDYIMVTKGGIRADQSMHVRFINDERTFRFIHRLDGQPATRTPLTPFKGNNTLSPYVVLGSNR